MFENWMQFIQILAVAQNFSLRTGLPMERCMEGLNDIYNKYKRVDIQFAWPE